MKRIIVSACLLLTFACGIFALELSQNRKAPRGGRRKQVRANRPPKIDSFQTEFGTVVIPCPDWNSPISIACTPNSDHTLRITTHASDQDRDSLLYTYTVTGGKIIGEGARVDWDYKGLTPGSYTVKVSVKDRRGGITSSSTSLKVIECPICDLPCTSIDVSCPITVEQGSPAAVTANVSGGQAGLLLTYNWSLSSGTLIKGQGTPAIEVDTTGLAGQRITVTLVVGGIPPECNREASCVIQIRK